MVAVANADRVIVDAYDIDDMVRDVIGRAATDPVYFDDYGSNIPDRGIVINGSPGARMIDYPERPGLVLLLGLQYQVLRKPFWQSTNRIIREHVESVGVMLGGTDHLGLMDQLLPLVGDAVPAEATVYAIGVETDAIRHAGVTATGRLTAQQMKDLFDRLDLLVTAAGQTVAEAVSCKLPTVMIQTAENQKYNVDGWRESCCTIYSDSQLSTALNSAMDSSTRSALAASAASLGLQESTMNLAVNIHRLAIRHIDDWTVTPFSLLNAESLREILSWRNDPRVSVWMDNQHTITWQDHVWFSRQLAHDNTKAFFRVDLGSIGIGVVDLTHVDRDNRRAELGLYRNPNLKGTQIGSKSIGINLMHVLEEIALQEHIVTLWLKVRRDNARAIQLYQKLSYHQCDEDKAYLYLEKTL
jgi:UDP-4-amino-4,6-dideoxy-N-acetyl-beta-L-altrosamine N-acetyltransferase